MDQTKLDMTTIINKLQNNQLTLLAGDINAHHPMWEDNCRNIDQLGYDISEIITNSEFCLLNTGTHTRQNLFNGTTSSPDITLCTQDIFMDSQWQCNQDNVGSDHFPIEIKITSYEEALLIKKVSNWKIIEKEINKIDSTKIKEICEFENQIMNIINKNTKYIHLNKEKRSKIWWSEKIKRFWDIKENKQKIYNKNRTIYTATELKKAQNKLKIEIKYAKKKNHGKNI